LRCRKILLCTLAASGVVACGREGAGAGRAREAALRVALDTSQKALAARVIVTGLSGPELRALRTAAAGWTNDDWAALVRVSVGGPESPAIVGRYAISDTSVEFRPLFPFDPGRAYTVRVDPSILPTPRSDSIVMTVLSLPAAARAAPATVVRVLPSADVLPENLLRMYIEFSAPMSRQPGVDFVHLVDDSGKEVRNAFLPLDADFWNRDHTRYTVFLDPGRVKRGILPNEQMGRALRAGHAFSLVVDSAWRDANGRPMASSYRRKFFAGPALQTGIAVASWSILPPHVETREPLVVKFPRPLDHGLLQRALGVETRRGVSWPGTIAVGDGEREWRFAPRDSWRAGDYQLVVLSILEDVAGNRVGRAFEVDMWDRVDSTSVPERTTLPFTVR
jgi:hypothetical protein